MRIKLADIRCSDSFSEWNIDFWLSSFISHTVYSDSTRNVIQKVSRKKCIFGGIVYKSDRMYFTQPSTSAIPLIHVTTVNTFALIESTGTDVFAGMDTDSWTTRETAQVRLICFPFICSISN